MVFKLLCPLVYTARTAPCVSREQVIARKRQEYADQVREHFNISASERSEDEAGALRQVSVDVPRTAPGVAFFHQEPLQRSLERILYIWGIRQGVLCTAVALSNGYTTSSCANSRAVL